MYQPYSIHRPISMLQEATMSTGPTRPQRLRHRRGRRVLLQALRRRAGQAPAGLRQLRHRRPAAQARPDRGPHGSGSRDRSAHSTTSASRSRPPDEVTAATGRLSDAGARDRRSRSRRPAATPSRTRSGSATPTARPGRSTPCWPTRRPRPASPATGRCCVPEAVGSVPVTVGAAQAGSSCC